MAPNPFAVIAGVGPGIGAAIARRFASSYPVVLLARKEESFDCDFAAKYRDTEL